MTISLKRVLTVRWSQPTVGNCCTASCLLFLNNVKTLDSDWILPTLKNALSGGSLVLAEMRWLLAYYYYYYYYYEKHNVKLTRIRSSTQHERSTLLLCAVIQRRATQDWQYIVVIMIIYCRPTYNIAGW